jgi:hypothetical protein
MNTSILRFAPLSVKNKLNSLVDATYGATTGGLKNLKNGVANTM